jgi:opacity protein-like surface antigen
MRAGSHTHLDATEPGGAPAAQQHIEDDASDAAYGFHVGFDFAKYLSLELAYADLGESSRERELLPVVIVLPGFFYSDPFGDTRTVYPPPTLIVPPDGSLSEPVFSIAIPVVTERATFQSKALALSVRGRYSMGERFGMFGGFGLASHWVRSRTTVRIDNRLLFDQKHDDHVNGGQVLLGADWTLHHNWVWRLQYERHFDVDSKAQNNALRSDVDVLTTGLSYRF